MMRFWNISAVALAFAAVAGVAQAQKGGTPALLPGGNSKDPISINAAKLDFFDKEQKLVYSGAGPRLAEPAMGAIYQRQRNMEF